MKYSSEKIKRKVFIFIGPEKTGTTTVFDLLPFHRVPLQKEMFNLSRKKDLKAERRRIVKQLLVQEAAYIVEPTYFISEFARQNIQKLSSDYDVCLIHTQRNPLKRSISHYLHHKSKGRVSNIDEALSLFPEILEASRYDKYLDKWVSDFSDVKVIDLDKNNNLEFGLNGLGIKARCNHDAISNRRLAPKNLFVAKYLTLCWRKLIQIGLNSVIPRALKKLVKKHVYYGGDPVEISKEEEECLKRKF